jgi:hypothetical protein
MRTHREHMRMVNPAVPCSAHHVTYGGACLNCGWTPEPPEPVTVCDKCKVVIADGYETLLGHRWLCPECYREETCING